MILRFTVRLLWVLAVVGRSAVSFLGLLLLHRGNPPRRVRAQWLHGVCRRVLRGLNVNLHVTGEPPAAGLLVSNHLSYLDILVFAAIRPVVFVSKAEVRLWPLFGWFARRAGTIFVERASRTDVDRVAREMRDALRGNQVVVLFAEGTTSNGHQVLPFRSSLLASAAADGRPVHAASIAYELEDGIPERDVCYWGDMRLLPHMVKLMSRKRVHAFVCFSGAEFREADRKALARRLYSEVVQLKSRTIPGTGAPLRQCNKAGVTTKIDETTRNGDH